MTTRAALFALLLATAACTPGTPADNGTTATAGTGIGVDVAGLNKGVNPGDDFEERANGGWRAKTEIPADRSSVGAFLEVYNKAEANNAAIIEQRSRPMPRRAPISAASPTGTTHSPIPPRSSSTGFRR